MSRPDQEHFRRLERMYARAPINAFFAPKLRVGEGEAEILMVAEPRFFHAARAVHGSIYFKALDDACWFAVNSLVEDVCVLTASFNLHLLRPVDSGELRAAGRVVHASRRLYVAEGTLEDARGRVLARGGGSFMRTTIALTPEIGYE